MELTLAGMWTLTFIYRPLDGFYHGMDIYPWVVLMCGGYSLGLGLLYAWMKLMEYNSAGWAALATDGNAFSLTGLEEASSTCVCGR